MSGRDLMTDLSHETVDLDMFPKCTYCNSHNLLRRYQTSLLETKNELQLTRDQLSSNRLQLSDTQRQLSAVQYELATTKNECQARVPKRDLVDAENRIAELEHSLQTLRQAMLDSSAKVSDTNGAGENGKAASSTTDNVVWLRKEVAVLETRLSASNRRLEESEGRLHYSENRLKESEASLRETERRLTEAESRSRETEGRLKVSQSRLKVFETEVAVGEGRLQDAQRQLATARREINDLRVRLGEDPVATTAASSPGSSFGGSPKTPPAGSSAVTDGSSSSSSSTSVSGEFDLQVAELKKQLATSQLELVRAQSELLMTVPKYQLTKALDHNQELQDSIQKANSRLGSLQAQNEQLAKQLQDGDREMVVLRGQIESSRLRQVKTDEELVRASKQLSEAVRGTREREQELSEVRRRLEEALLRESDLKADLASTQSKMEELEAREARTGVGSGIGTGLRSGVPSSPSGRRVKAGSSVDGSSTSVDSSNEDSSGRVRGVSVLEAAAATNLPSMRMTGTRAVLGVDEDGVLSPPRKEAAASQAQSPGQGQGQGWGGEEVAVLSREVRSLTRRLVETEANLQVVEGKLRDEEELSAEAMDKLRACEAQLMDSYAKFDDMSTAFKRAQQRSSEQQNAIAKCEARMLEKDVWIQELEIKLTNSTSAPPPPPLTTDAAAPTPSAADSEAGEGSESEGEDGRAVGGQGEGVGGEGSRLRQIIREQERWLGEAKDSLEHTRSQLLGKITYCAELSRRLADTQAEAEGLRQRLKEAGYGASDELQRERQEAMQLKMSLSALQARLEDTARHLVESQQRLRASDERVLDSEKRLADLTQVLDDTLEELRGTQRELSLVKEAASKESAGLTEMQLSLSLNQQELCQRLTTATAELQLRDGKIQSLQTQLATAESKVGELRRSLEVVGKDLAETRSELVDTRCKLVEVQVRSIAQSQAQSQGQGQGQSPSNSHSDLVQRSNSNSSDTGAGVFLAMSSGSVARGRQAEADRRETDDHLLQLQRQLAETTEQLTETRNHNGTLRVKLAEVSSELEVVKGLLKDAEFTLNERSALLEDSRIQLVRFESRFDGLLDTQAQLADSQRLVVALEAQLTTAKDLLRSYVPPEQWQLQLQLRPSGVEPQAVLESLASQLAAARKDLAETRSRLQSAEADKLALERERDVVRFSRGNPSFAGSPTAMSASANADEKKSVALSKQLGEAEQKLAESEGRVGELVKELTAVRNRLIETETLAMDNGKRAQQLEHMLAATEQRCVGLTEEVARLTRGLQLQVQAQLQGVPAAPSPVSPPNNAGGSPQLQPPGWSEQSGGGRNTFMFLRNENNDLKRRLSDATANFKEIATQLNEAERQLSRAHSELEESRAKTAAGAARCGVLEGVVVELERRLEVSSQAIIEGEDRRREMEGAALELRKRIEAMEGVIGDKNREIAALVEAGEATRGEVVALETEKLSLEGQASELESQLFQCEITIRNHEGVIDDYSLRLRDAQAALAETRAQLQEAQSRVAELDNTIYMLNSPLNAWRGAGGSRASGATGFKGSDEVAELQRQLGEMTQKWRDADREVVVLRGGGVRGRGGGGGEEVDEESLLGQQEGLLKKVAELENALVEKSSELFEAQSQLSTLQPKVVGMDAQLRKRLTKFASQLTEQQERLGRAEDRFSVLSGAVKQSHLRRAEAERRCAEMQATVDDLIHGRGESDQKALRISDEEQREYAEQMRLAEERAEQAELRRVEYETKAGSALVHLDKLLTEAEERLEQERSLRQEADVQLAVLSEKMESDHSLWEARVAQLERQLEVEKRERLRAVGQNYAAKSMGWT